MPITDHIDDIKRIDDIEVLAEVPTIYTSTSNVITQGNIAIDATTITKNFAAVTYTGNGTTQDTVTGISSVDFTVSANGSGYWLDRTVNQVKTDAGVVQVSAGSCVVNTSKVHIKSRSIVSGNVIIDGIRNGINYVFTNEVNAEAEDGNMITAFTQTGFTLGISGTTNQNLVTYIAYQTLYTHIKWGVTSQGKFQIEAYNPVTEEGMIYYIGSGLAGHQISHSMGVEIDYLEVKSLDSTHNWQTNTTDYRGTLNTTASFTALDSYAVYSSKDNIYTGSNVASENNNGSYSYIMYYKCKSETFTIGTYTGTGVAGNFIETKDVNGVARKPRRIIFKRTDIANGWHVTDSERGETAYFFLDTSAAEGTASIAAYNTNGFTISDTGNGTNASGGQYLYLVEFDTNGDGGDSYFPLPTDDTNLNLTSVVANYTNGKDKNGFIRSTESVTASVDFTGVSDGFKWVAKEEGGTYSFYNKEPSVGLYEKLSADDNRLVFSDGKYYTTTGGELVTNGTFDTDTTGWTSVAIGAGTFVEYLPSLTYDNGSALLTNGAGAIDWASIEQQVTGLVIGEKYSLLLDVSASNDYSVVISESSIIGKANAPSEMGSYTSQGNIEFTSTSTTIFILAGVLGIVEAHWARIDNITCYKTEATLGTPLTTPISLIPNPIMVQSETPQYIDYSRSLSENVMEDLEVAGDITTHGEFKGKNACTAWVNFDGTTTPPTIRDSFNVSDVVRTSTGVYDIYFEEDMDNSEYIVSASTTAQDVNGNLIGELEGDTKKTTSKFRARSFTISGTNTDAYLYCNVYGGKN